MEAWKQYVHWACYSPVIGFAVPCVITDGIWHDTAVTKGILLDRPRIVNSVSDGVLDPSLAAALNKWIKTQLENYDE